MTVRELRDRLSLMCTEGMGDWFVDVMIPANCEEGSSAIRGMVVFPGSQTISIELVP